MDAKQKAKKFIDKNFNEIADEKLPLDSLKENIKKETHKVFLKKIKDGSLNIDKLLENHIKRIILVSIGFGDTWGRIEVDHCNGRTSEVTKAVSAAVSSQVAELVKSVNFNDIFSQKELSDMKAAIVSDLKSRFKRDIQDKVYRHMSTVMDERVNKIINDAHQEAIVEMGLE